MSIAGQKVVETAARYVGVKERPNGSNDDGGGPITRWQTLVGLAHLPAASKPWCATFCFGIYREAGVPDDGLIHPYTGYICQRAREQGKVGAPRPGALIVWCSTHVGILVAPAGGGNWHTIEGNSSNMVARRVRSLSGTTIVVPSEVAKGAGGGRARERLYYLEDLRPERKLYPYAHLSYAINQCRKLGLDPDEAIKRAGDGRYVVVDGQPRHYGPWLAEVSVEEAQPILEKRLGRRLRRWSETRAIGSGRAQALGQTQ